MFDAAPLPDPAPLQQSDAFARALDAAGTPAMRLADGTLVLRRGFGPLPVSMITRPQNTDPEGLRDLARSASIWGPCLISPDRPVPLQSIGAAPLVSPATLAWIDLTRDRASLMAGLGQKWRNRLRHAGTQALRVTRQNLPDDPAHWLLQADREQQAARGYRSWPIPLTLAFARANPGGAKLFTACQGEKPVAAILLLRHGSCATYHIGHTHPSGRQASAHNLLMWSAMLWAKSKGLRTLELGTIDTEDGRGLARFKLGTGAETRPLGGTWLWWPPLTSLVRPVAQLDLKLMRLR